MRSSAWLIRLTIRSQPVVLGHPRQDALQARRQQRVMLRHQAVGSGSEGRQGDVAELCPATGQKMIEEQVDQNACRTPAFGRHASAGVAKRRMPVGKGIDRAVQTHALRYRSGQTCRQRAFDEIPDQAAEAVGG
jgi:hypothetical protein